MKKLTNFITNLGSKIYSSSILRIAFYVLVILLILALYLFGESAKIEFVYNDF